MSTTLCIFAKAPERGRVKSRLAADLGAEVALQVYEELLAVTAAVARSWTDHGPVAVHGTGDLDRFAASPLAEWPIREQYPGTLGERLAHGLGPAVASGGRALAIGTDCPGLALTDLLAMAALLEEAQVAFGPSNDGGYWCLGVASAAAVASTCAADLPWSQPSLLVTSQQRCDDAGLRWRLGPTAMDVDTGADLAAAREAGWLPIS